LPIGRVITIDVHIVGVNLVGEVRVGGVLSIDIGGHGTGEVRSEIETDIVGSIAHTIGMTFDCYRRFGVGRFVLVCTSCEGYRGREDKEINKSSHIIVF